MEKGRLVVFEGACDGVGKTTQYNMLVDRLKEEGECVINYHFPSYGTQRGAEVEKFLRGEYGNPKDLSPYFVHGLYAEDRRKTWHQILKSEWEQGRIILLDRYTTSSLVYQPAFMSSEEEKLAFMDYVCNKEYIINEIKVPDIVLFLTGDFNLITRIRNERKSNEGIVQDVFERDLEIQRNIYETSLLAAKCFGWEEIVCDNSDKSSLKSIKAIHEEVYSRVRKLV